ncbi:MAG: PspC domain-containing protein [Sulfuricaulis sp.]
MRYRPRQRRDTTYYLPATKLAAMGHCETKIVLEGKYGDRATPEQARARVEGTVAHRRFDRVVSAAHNRPRAQDRRCFVASCVYGPDDARTDQLREYRDRVLAPVASGRALIAVYYAISPWLVRVLERSPWLKAMVCRAVDRFRLWTRK